MRNAESRFPMRRRVRRWVNHFGPEIAADLRNRRPKPHTIWHLDEVYLKFDGRFVYLWRAVDAEGAVLDALVQTRRNKRAALKLMRKLLKKYGFVPDKLVTDELDLMPPRSVILESQNATSVADGATIERRIRISQPDEGRGRCKGSRAWDSAQRFLSVDAAAHNTFNGQRHLISAPTQRAFRSSAMKTWRAVAPLLSTT